jgi:hypothetical protein
LYLCENYVNFFCYVGKNFFGDPPRSPTILG